jgi:transglutaminase-like putative cysteine protease
MQLDVHRPTLLADLPSGEAGTYATVRLMRRFVQQFKTSTQVRQEALALIQDLPQKDWYGEVEALFSWVRDHIRYVRDINGVETLQTPLVTMELGTGDCDDKASLLASLLESIGHPTRFVAVGFQHPREYSHVYLETRIGTRWIPLDATLIDKPMGTAPMAPTTARMVVHN